MRDGEVFQCHSNLVLKEIRYVNCYVNKKLYLNETFTSQPNAILSKLPIELMNRQNLINIPVMMGYNSEEGIITLYDIYKKFNLYDKDIAKMIPRSLNIPNESPSEPESLKLGDAIRKFYFNGQKLSDKLLTEMSKLQTDYHFAIGSHLYAEMHSRRQPK